jgi:hypothetical protein
MGIVQHWHCFFPAYFPSLHNILQNFLDQLVVQLLSQLFRGLLQNELKHYTEVKGRSGSDGSVMLSENEVNRLAQLGNAAWLYIVMNCKSDPEIYRIQNPSRSLNFELKTKGVQYFLPMEEWKHKAL